MAEPLTSEHLRRSLGEHDKTVSIRNLHQCWEDRFWRFERRDAARDILRNAPGVVVIDDRAANHFTTPLEVSNRDDVAVGIIRSDVSQDGNYGLDIFVCGDQIRKGAALNAV